MWGIAGRWLPPAPPGAVARAIPFPAEFHPASLPMQAA
jgi:hypothetical protein